MRVSACLGSGKSAARHLHLNILCLVSEIRCVLTVCVCTLQLASLSLSFLQLRSSRPHVCLHVRVPRHKGYKKLFVYSKI